MNLAVDIGNTRTKIGIFDCAHLLKVEAFDNAERIAINDIIIQNNIQKAIISSTIDIPTYLSEGLQTVSTNLILDKNTQLPFKNRYQTQDTLGKDRLALIAAASAQFPEQDTLVIGCGTCITFNFINHQQEFLGGSIHPGIKMRMKAMHIFTGKLPYIEPETVHNFMANNTTNSLLVGGIYGAVKEIDGIINDYLVKFPQMNIIITGGDADLLVSMLKNKIFAVPNFTLIGLNYILNYNA